MAANCSETAPAAVLTELFATHPDLSPEVSGMTWSLPPTGILRAELKGATDNGRAVDRCAEVMGGTPVSACLYRGQDRVVLTELAVVWHGVPVEVWETYPVPEPPRPLGTLVVLSRPAGGDR